MQEIELEPCLDIGFAEKLKEHLLTALAADNKILLDAGKVERITTPCIQLLIATDRALSENGGSLTMKSATEAVVTAFQDIGLEEMYERWSEQE